jgi:cell cycle checkpoint control protein RAD9A
VSVSDFEQFEAQEKLHIIISVKDFKSIVNHADTLQNTTINAYYSTPGRPLQFSYSKDGIQCQFTLMTTGEYNGTPAPSAAPPTAPPRQISRAQSTASTAFESMRSDSDNMPPPAKPSPRRPVRRLGQNESPAASQLRQQQEDDPESLFVPAGEEDRRWDPADYENDEETLGWDASASNVCSLVVRLVYEWLTNYRILASTRHFGTAAQLQLVLTQRRRNDQIQGCRQRKGFHRYEVSRNNFEYVADLK